MAEVFGVCRILDAKRVFFFFFLFSFKDIIDCFEIGFWEDLCYVQHIKMQGCNSVSTGGKTFVFILRNHYFVIIRAIKCLDGPFLGRELQLSTTPCGTRSSITP